MSLYEKLRNANDGDNFNVVSIYGIEGVRLTINVKKSYGIRWYGFKQNGKVVRKHFAMCPTALEGVAEDFAEIN
jgi:hypothetical protein